MSFNLKKEIKYNPSDKDILISQLKAQIFELDQNQCNFQSLNIKYRNLQNDFKLLNEDKMKLEYESKQKTENNSKTTSQLRIDLDNLNDSYNEKLITNKKFFDKIEKLEKMLETSENEKEDLHKKLRDLSTKYNRLSEENRENIQSVRDILTKNVELNETKKKNHYQIDKLSEELNKFKKNLEDREKNIKTLENERLRLMARLEDVGFENGNLILKLKKNEDNLLKCNKHLDDARHNINSLQVKERELNLLYENSNNELEKSRFSHNRETKIRIESENRIQELEKIINERDTDIKRKIEDLNSCKDNIESLDAYNNNLFFELDKMKNHILVLTEQNQVFCNELDNFVEQDEKMKNKLNKRERVSKLKISNQLFLEKSLTSLDKNNTKDSSTGFIKSNGLSSW